MNELEIFLTDGNKPILLTVPHGYCVDDITGYRHCDINAFNFARRITKKWKFYAIQNRTFRYIKKGSKGIYDMNRIHSRGTDFRLTIDTYLDSLRKKYNVVPLLYDIHTFNKGGYDEPKNTDIVLLPLHSSDKELVDILYNELSRNLNVEIYHGSDENDITYKANVENRAVSILIEIFEELKSEKVDLIGSALMNTFLRYYTYYDYFVVPTFGRVVKIEKNTITTLIDIRDNHLVFSPVDGKLRDLAFLNGVFKHKIFESVITKKGRAIIQIFDINNMDYFIFLEVGEGYVTNRVRIDIEINQEIERSDIIGEILLGSLSEIRLPSYKSLRILVNENEKVVGGVTPIAFIE